MKSNTLMAQFVDILDEIHTETGERIPGIIMSSPGVGKTTTLQKFCELRDYNLTSLIASQYAPDDILGLQSVINGDDVENARLRRLTPDWFDKMWEKSKNGKRNVLFLDEISTCDETIQAPLLNLIFQGDVGGRRAIPENTLIIAAGNYTNNLNGAFKMTDPLVNRFMILNVRAEDQDLKEMKTIRFKDLHGDELREFLDLIPVEEPYWDFDKVEREFLYKKIKLSDTYTITNNSEEGLLGIPSTRVVDWCSKFMYHFARKYKSDLWMRVVGDTLGKIYENGKDDKGFPAREHLISRRDTFVTYNGIKASDGKTLVQSILEACDKGKKEGYEQLRNYIAKPQELSNADIAAITQAAKKDSQIQTIMNQINAALMEGMFA